MREGRDPREDRHRLLCGSVHSKILRGIVVIVARAVLAGLHDYHFHHWRPLLRKARQLMTTRQSMTTKHSFIHFLFPT